MDDDARIGDVDQMIAMATAEIATTTSPQALEEVRVKCSDAAAA